MAILRSVRAWWARRRQHELEVYADERGFVTAEELDGLNKRNKADRGRAGAFGYHDESKRSH